GYGARLAYGCNIGAYLGGLVSGSLHGWLWLVFGFLGSLLGTRLRIKLGMG
ncbi:YeeE/YedE thiosulfate transporter family protein, partial [Roseibium sp.]